MGREQPELEDRTVTEGHTVHGTIEDHGRGHAGKPERSGEGGRLPMPVRYA